MVYHKEGKVAKEKKSYRLYDSPINQTIQRHRIISTILLQQTGTNNYEISKLKIVLIANRGNRLQQFE